MRFFRRSAVAFFLAAFALRAIVPVGYMPDFAGHSEGVFSVALCDGSDHSAHHHHGADETQKPCPFSFGTAFTTPLLTLPPEAAPVFAEALPSPAAELFPRFAAFANASPRSPPTLS